VHVIQAQRKDLDCQYTDRVELAIVTVDAAVQAAARQFADYICGETLAKILGSDPIVGVDPIEAKLGDAAVQLYVRIVK
jgi:isoleucyl-tRNA synthetase